jgi:hypothetical protein
VSFKWGCWKGVIITIIVVRPFDLGSVYSVKSYRRVSLLGHRHDLVMYTSVCRNNGSQG